MEQGWEWELKASGPRLPRTTPGADAALRASSGLHTTEPYGIVIYMTTTYRIQQPEHSLSLLLDPATQLSTNRCDDDDVRQGVSACLSIEDLADYFAQVGIPLTDECLLVEMDSEWADGDDADAAHGAHLVIPTAIISAIPVPDSFYELVGNAYDRLSA